MAIATLDDLIAALPGQHRHYQKIITGSAGFYQSSWLSTGFPGAGANPPARTAGSGYIPTDTTAGCICPFTNPGGSDLTYLAGYAALATVTGSFVLYDRVWHCSGMDGTVATAQTITTPGSVDRPSGGDDVELWLEWYSTTGSTSRTVTVSYTNQAGTSGRTTQSFTLPASVATGRMYALPLQSGDYGVQSVASLTLSGTTGTAGNFGITLMKRIAEIPMGLQNTGDNLDPLQLRMPTIPNDACLSLMWMATGASTQVLGSVDLVQG